MTTETTNDNSAPLLEPWQILDLLARLIEKSLVIHEEFPDGRSRYRLLETVRQYAGDRLFQAGEGEAARNGHLAFFQALQHASVAGMEGSDAGAWLDRLETEHDNLRAALGHARESPPHAGAALQMAGGLQRFWEVRGYFSEGREQIRATLTRTGQAASGQDDLRAARADALRALGTLSRMQGDYAAAVAALEESLHLQRAQNNAPGVVRALVNLGVVVYDQGDYAGARAHFEEALALQRQIGGDDKSIAMILGNLGVLAREQGDVAAARALYEEAILILRRLGNLQALANTVSNLGAIAHDEEDFTAARALYEESLQIRRDLDDRSGTAISLINLGLAATDEGAYGEADAFLRESRALLAALCDKRLLAYALEATAALASVWARPGDAERAARIWGAAESLREALGAPLPPHERPHYERNVARVRATLGEDAFTNAWDAGRELPPEQAADIS